MNLTKQYDLTPFDSPKKYNPEENILRLDSWNLDKRINILINSLDAPNGEREIPSLSGDEKKRVALCRALIPKPGLHILEEPTNHLDTKAIEWLENFLSSCNGTYIFVTHDRYFLDRIAKRIVELSSETFYSSKELYWLLS